jgi:hypothetical protein
LCASGLHLFLIFLFAYLGVPALSVYNALSLGLWVLIVILVKRGYVAQAYPLAFFELVIHAGLVVLFLGWDFGAQYYLLPALSAAILVPIKRWQHISSCADRLCVCRAVSVQPQQSAPGRRGRTSVGAGPRVQPDFRGVRRLWAECHHHAVLDFGGRTR